MRTATSKPVYTSSEEANGHVVVFDVSMRNFQTTRVAIRLPEPCKFYDESYEPDLMAESTFIQGEGNHLETRNGFPSTELLATAEVIAAYMSDPLHKWIGLRARSNSEGTVLIAYLAPDIDMQLLCEEMADAIYEKVAAVTYQHSWFGGMSYFEQRDWRNHQLMDY